MVLDFYVQQYNLNIIYEKACRPQDYRPKSKEQNVGHGMHIQ